MKGDREAVLASVLQRRRALEAKKDQMAAMAMEVFDLLPPWPSHTQLQGLRTAATSTDSVEEVKIFIQYQIGRGKIKKLFGDDLVKKIEELQSEASEGDPQLVIEMVRYFLGNVMRYGRFKDFVKKQEEKEKREAKRRGQGGR